LAHSDQCYQHDGVVHIGEQGIHSQPSLEAVLNNVFSEQAKQSNESLLPSSKPNLRSRHGIPRYKREIYGNPVKKRKEVSKTHSESDVESDDDDDEGHGPFTANLPEPFSFQPNPIQEPETLKEFVGHVLQVCDHS